MTRPTSAVLTVSIVCAAGAVVSSSAAAASTYCRYQYYNDTMHFCVDEPPAKAESECEKKATEEHGEKIDCYCTDDPNVVEEFCKSGFAKPKPEPKLWCEVTSAE